MLTLGRPDLDWVAMAKGMGVPARRVDDCDQLAKALSSGLSSGGPNLIQVTV